MAQLIDLREYPRFDGDGFVAQIGQELVKVIDISIAGVRLERAENWISCRNIEFQIIPVLGNELDHFRAVDVRGHVVGVDTSQLRIVYAAVSMALANVIGCYGEMALPEAG
ncbi:MAG TPA: hypothetical protein VK558_07715 [Patescibacteria group bacterium]|nr:hypothetical protein [Patescibacteria group bacterium]